MAHYKEILIPATVPYNIIKLYIQSNDEKGIVLDNDALHEHFKNDFENIENAMRNKIQSMMTDSHIKATGVITFAFDKNPLKLLAELLLEINNTIANNFYSEGLLDTPYRAAIAGVINEYTKKANEHADTGKPSLIYSHILRPPRIQSTYNAADIMTEHLGNYTRFMLDISLYNREVIAASHVVAIISTLTSDAPGLLKAYTEQLLTYEKYVRTATNEYYHLFDLLTEQRENVKKCFDIEN